jgi:hypothetical protein
MQNFELLLLNRFGIMLPEVQHPIEHENYEKVFNSGCSGAVRVARI